MCGLVRNLHNDARFNSLFSFSFLSVCTLIDDRIALQHCQSVVEKRVRHLNFVTIFIADEPEVCQLTLMSSILILSNLLINGKETNLDTMYHMSIQNANLDGFNRVNLGNGQIYRICLRSPQCRHSFFPSKRRLLLS